MTDETQDRLIHAGDNHRETPQRSFRRDERIADGSPHATVDDMHPCANCGHPLAEHGKGAEPPIACEDFTP